MTSGATVFAIPAGDSSDPHVKRALLVAGSVAGSRGIELSPVGRLPWRSRLCTESRRKNLAGWPAGAGLA